MKKNIILALMLLAWVYIRILVPAALLVVPAVLAIKLSPWWLLLYCVSFTVIPVLFIVTHRFDEPEITLDNEKDDE